MLLLVIPGSAGILGRRRGLGMLGGYGIYIAVLLFVA